MASETRDERWAAEKREFVADSRDEAADARDAAADARDARAEAQEAADDARRVELDRREERLDQRAQELGMQAEDFPGEWSGDPGAARDLAVQEREDARRGREQQKESRDEALRRRLTQGRPRLLALAFASIAEQLYAAATYEEVLTRVAEAAISTVAGGEAASVTLLEHGTYRTAASTDEAATEVDQAQYDSKEGPSLDAVNNTIVEARLFPDDRWPILGGAPTEHGVESSVSYQLGTRDADGSSPGIGALNVYGTTPEAFDQAAVEIGSILAAHASLAARAVGERTSLERIGHDLEQALLSRDIIGQAKGILMERLKTTPEEAFDILKNSSQRLNLKLREVALRITETGEVDPDQLRHG